jgi:hypothetical protein
VAAAFARFLDNAGARAALHCETFPQAQRAVATKRFASLLPTLAQLDLTDTEMFELPSTFTRKLVLAWHPRLERQRPEIATLVPLLGQALQLPR